MTRAAVGSVGKTIKVVNHHSYRCVCIFRLRRFEFSLSSFLCNKELSDPGGKREGERERERDYVHDVRACAELFVSFGWSKAFLSF